MTMPALCGKCGDGVDDKGLQCDACGKWFHCKCGDVPQQLYTALGRFKCTGIKWFCGNCVEGVGKLLEGMGGMKDRQDKLEADVEEIKKELGEMRKEREEMGKEKISFAEILKRQMTEEQIAKDKGKIEGGNTRAEEREFQLHLTEALERDKKRKNLVIMGIPEQDDARTKETIKDIFTVLGIDSADFEFEGRIGKEGAKARPVRICIEIAEDKRNILKKARALKGDKQFEKVYICPDLTRKQQEEDKTLRDKVKQFKGRGVIGVKISRGQVIREDASIEGGREVLFELGK